ncbi:MAG: molybdopterin synthase catalytic subunit/molybdopterin synthase sulfur carrier subunit [Candidatus Kentron sp. G]|nr:MAG: molybdopterin synthase catalytic subunit/molybdopterin synthase sulfur carrier subunit [Candidatus Kentron sp. G]VFN00363.1 MAG: molybdopterin synthase catalytic subunit/molybdopterin synthase sulfur carrier subunit [Candidatus Kentron sp. G]VFN02205.1 MAG: molybdopterin synthase catalytic subunit/molybdopterin synthase sulfur carrier subunit [Candidatus Kentron sp. G]
MSETTMRYRVTLFAGLKEHTGREEWIHEGDAALTARELLHAFFDQYPGLEKLREVTRIAINHAFCREDSPVDPADELAFIPPVSGG